MPRRPFTYQDSSQAQALLDRVRRTASNQEDGNVLYNPQAFRDLKVSLGHKSLTLGFMRAEYETIDKLQKGVIELVKHRLLAQDVNFPSLNATNMSWCIPRTQDEEPAWRLLLEDPMLFTVDMLDALIALDEWTADTPAPSTASNLLYLRTFEVSAEVLQDALDVMDKEGYGTHERVQHWQKRLDEDLNVGEIPAVYTLRYCGQTTGSPWERHRGDMYGQLKTFFGRFLKVLGQTPEGIEVLKGAKVHTLSDAFQQVSTQTADLREQIIIALFGDGTLNSQAGGKDIITLYREDRDNFDHLQTQTTQLLITVGSGQFTDQTEAMILRQATPSVLANGSAVMVTLASDLGEDHEDAEDTFWEAGGRSVDAVSRIYNFFSSWEGPTALESVDANATKNLAANGHLPLVDLFPWFTKVEKDYLKASELLRRYMNKTKPMIVLGYGERQIFAAQESFRDFTLSDFGSWKKMCLNYGRTVPIGQPYLCHFDGKSAGKHDPETAVILVPSLHPGFLSKAGIVKEKATRLFVMTSAIAWCTMSTALTIARAGIPAGREEYAKMILADVETKIGPDTGFGKALATARQEYEICRQAYREGQVKRRDAPTLKIPTGILPKKSVRAQKKSRYSKFASHSDEGVGGWELSIKSSTCTDIQDFYTISWTDDDGETQEIGPCPLDKDSLKHAHDFIEYWEDLASTSFADEIVSAHRHVTVDKSEGCVPGSFFAQSISKHGMPFPRSALTSKMMTKFVGRTIRPAQSGDLLWLLEQFFLDILPASGDVDPVSVSEHPTYSIYGKLMHFASRPKFQHHPHNYTLRAMAHLSEQGVDDRRVPWNILLLAIEILRPGSTSRKRNLKRSVPGKDKIETSRQVRTVGAGPATTSAVVRYTIPSLIEVEEELGDVRDVTDDEEMGDSSGSDDDADGDGGNGGNAGSTGMDWAQTAGDKRKRRDDDDEEKGDDDYNDDEGGGSTFDKPEQQKRARLQRSRAS
ncbi:hypothetical protein DE146DRAFT_626241 [Phaeosphaeria sp. MPI-PUGE-AT-0046c]|nr:hypothetical protein DE146DRAFT_626241 [Phaeosphaeria sp. MPI-PUGE-AT-0046c]